MLRGVMGKSADIFFFFVARGEVEGVVKSMEWKYIGLCPRRFETCRLRCKFISSE